MSRAIGADVGLDEGEEQDRSVSLGAPSIPEDGSAVDLGRRLAHRRLRRGRTAVMLGVGSLIAGIAWFNVIAASQERLLTEGQRTQARVVETHLFCQGAIGPGCGQPGSVAFDPRIVVQFTADRQLRTATVHIGEDSTYAAGGTVVVYYDPSNPAHARTLAERNWPLSTWVAFALLCTGLIAPIPGVVIAVRGKRELRSFQGPSRPALIEHWMTRFLSRPRVVILDQGLQPVGLMVPTQPVGMLRGGWLPRFTELAVVGQRAEALVSWGFREASPDGWPRHGARVTILIPGPPQVISGRLLRHGRRYSRLRHQQGQEGLIHAAPAGESLPR